MRDPQKCSTFWHMSEEAQSNGNSYGTSPQWMFSSFWHCGPMHGIWTQQTTPEKIQKGKVSISVGFIKTLWRILQIMIRSIRCKHQVAGFLIVNHKTVRNQVVKCFVKQNISGRAVILNWMCGPRNDVVYNKQVVLHTIY